MMPFPGAIGTRMYPRFVAAGWAGNPRSLAVGKKSVHMRYVSACTMQ